MNTSCDNFIEALNAELLKPTMDIVTIADEFLKAAESSDFLEATVIAHDTLSITWGRQKQNKQIHFHYIRSVFRTMLARIAILYDQHKGQPTGSMYGFEGSITSRRIESEGELQIRMNNTTDSQFISISRHEVQR